MGIKGGKQSCAVAAQGYKWRKWIMAVSRMHNRCPQRQTYDKHLTVTSNTAKLFSSFPTENYRVNSIVSPFSLPQARR